MTFDPTKPVRTRDGRKARIIYTDASGPRPIVALIVEKEGYEFPHQFSKNGSYFVGGIASELDLINIPERKVQWTNVYEHDISKTFDSRTIANAFAKTSRLGVLKLTYENDELVSHEYIKIRL